LRSLRRLALLSPLRPFGRSISLLRGQVFLIAVIKTKSSVTSNATKGVPGVAKGPPKGCQATLAFFRYWGKVIGVSMITTPLRLEEVTALRRLVPAFGFVASLGLAMVPGLARAQVNIDQGKSPAEIYASDCATCHKTPRGLAAGRNSLMLSGFLREHYTTSGDQAAALAAYVLGAGGREPAPPAAKPKPDVEHARAEEPKATEPKTATHPLRASAKTEDEKPPTEQETKREEHASPAIAEPREVRPETASRGEKREPESAAPVLATPAAHETPNTAETQSPNSSPASSPDASPTTSAAIPAEEQPTAGATVPRDNIPD
jgi:mono/diheme cytochrome c family protein